MQYNYIMLQILVFIMLQFSFFADTPAWHNLRVIQQNPKRPARRATTRRNERSE